jgi:hypothetical protein
LSFKKLRIFALLLLLVLVAGTSLWEGMLVRGWMRPLEVVIYPINGDGSDQTRAYIASLSASQFDEIGDFFKQQSQRYRLQQFPGMQIRLEPAIQAPPPQTDSSAHSALSAIAWSLRLRYFAFRNTLFWQNLGRIRLFIVFHAGEQGKPKPHKTIS